MGEKYTGIIPAFYACYDNDGNVSSERTRELVQHLVNKGVNGLYVAGSSGECIYQSVNERKMILENVVAVSKGKITIIAHVAANNTEDSMELARHAESMGVDAIAAIPPIYFKLPNHAVAQYWNDISSAAPNTDFIIYNIPQLSGITLTPALYEEMLKNKKVVGVKNSSMEVLDIQVFKSLGGVVLNGPDEQFISGRVMGADGGIGGTYGVMPELFLELEKSIKDRNLEVAQSIQCDINKIIFTLCSGTGSMYAVIKGVLKLQGIDIGTVRKPLAPLTAGDCKIVERANQMIEEALGKYIYK